MNILFLPTLPLVSTSICLFHTEKLLGKDPSCPACKFQNMTLVTAHIDLVEIIVPSASETLCVPRESCYKAIPFPLIVARAPPLA